MVDLHTEATPRVPGDSLRGKRPKDYGRGRVCTQPGCTTILRRTHAGPVCDPCQDNHRCGPSACSTAAPTAAPAVRRAKEEKVARTNGREAVLTVFARDPSRCFNASDVQEACGVSHSAVYKNLSALVASGDLVKRAPGVYRWPKTEDAKLDPEAACEPASNVVEKTEQEITAVLGIPGAVLSHGRAPTFDEIAFGYADPAPASPPAPAPGPDSTTSGQEPPADPLAADSPPVMPPAFAGIKPEPKTITVSLRADASRMLSGIDKVMGRDELSILANIERLDDAARERVLQYAFARWPGPDRVAEQVIYTDATGDGLAASVLDTIDRWARMQP